MLLCVWLRVVTYVLLFVAIVGDLACVAFARVEGVVAASAAKVSELPSLSSKAEEKGYARGVLAKSARVRREGEASLLRTHGRNNHD